MVVSTIERPQDGTEIVRELIQIQLAECEAIKVISSTVCYIFSKNKHDMLICQT